MPFAKILHQSLSSFCRILPRAMERSPTSFAANSRRSIRHNHSLAESGRTSHGPSAHLGFKIAKRELNSAEFWMLVVIESEGDVQKISGQQLFLCNSLGQSPAYGIVTD